MPENLKSLIVREVKGLTFSQGHRASNRTSKTAIVQPDRRNEPQETYGNCQLKAPPHIHTGLFRTCFATKIN